MGEPNMRILVITRNAWDDTNAIGNTLSNFFSNIDDVEFAAIYFRSAMPNNKLCSNYYNTSEFDIIRNWCTPSRIGKHFRITDGDGHKSERNVSSSEKKLIRAIQRWGIKLAYKFSDFLWYSEKWINSNLDDFIEDFSPDMMVTFVKSAPQYYLTVKYLREKYDIPLFSWIADDEYTGLLKTNSPKEIQNLRYILNTSKVVKGCSKPLCDYYNSIFGCRAEPLYKSCDLSASIKERNSNSITIVYAGNLLYGRLDSICSIADVLEDLSGEFPNIIFEVYSNTALLPQEEEIYFKSRPIIRYKGKRDYDFIKKRLLETDISLHVESFEEEQVLKTKYSFSTKIIDYLQSGSVILAIGPQELASIQYIQGIPGTVVINELDELTEKIKVLFQEKNQFSKMASETRMYAQQYHSSQSALENMRGIINETTEGEI